MFFIETQVNDTSPLGLMFILYHIDLHNSYLYDEFKVLILKTVL